MTKKIPLGIVFILLLVIALISASVTAFVIIEKNSSLLIDLPQRASQYQQLNNVDELVRSEYYGDIDFESVDNSLASGFLNGLNDVYCYYITPEDIDAYEDIINGRMYGIGLTVYYDESVGCLSISNVDVDSPSYDIGIAAEQHIISVNGQTVDNNNYGVLISELSDTFNKKVKISVADSGNLIEIKEYELTSGYQAKSCYYTVNDNVGYIRISDFYESTTLDFQNALNFISSSSVSSLILDLRNSSGTNLDVAADIIDMIVPIGSEGSGSIFTAKNADGEIIKQISSDATSINISIAVLVNSKTECAAELIACDLRDHGKAIIIGENTAGHGTMQQLFKLDDGSAVLLTVAEIYPYISESFDIVGVHPDIEITSQVSVKELNDDNFDFTDDEQYQKAHSYLSGN